MSAKAKLSFGAWPHALSPSIVNKSGEFKSYADLALGDGAFLGLNIYAYYACSDGSLFVNKVAASNGQKVLFRRQNASKWEKLETAGSIKNAGNKNYLMSLLINNLFNTSERVWWRRIIRSNSQ